MKVKVYGISDVGMRRERNEDSYLVNEKLGLYVVADGMGGHVGGEFASKLAVQTINDVIEDISEGPEKSDILKENKIDPKDYRTQLLFSIRKASQRIFQEAKNDSNLKGMGTTSVVILTRGGKLYLANVGDSRGYIIRDDEIFQLTADHSLVGEQLRAGIISEMAAKGHKFKNIITRSVGFQENVDIDLVTKVPKEGDKFLLCSDGLTNMIDDDEILEVINDNKPDDVCQILVDLANARGGDDNITLILLDIIESDGTIEEEVDPSEETTIGI